MSRIEESLALTLAFAVGRVPGLLLVLPIIVMRHQWRTDK